MLSIEVEFFSLIQEITNVKKKQIVINKDNPNVADLLDILFKEFGSKFENAIFDRKSKELKPGVLLAVDGKNAYLLQSMETPLMEITLMEGNKIVIGYMLMGG